MSDQVHFALCAYTGVADYFAKVQNPFIDKESLYALLHMVLYHCVVFFFNQFSSLRVALT